MTDRKIKIGIIGFGRMGQLYCKEILKNPKYDLIYICDKNPVACELATNIVPQAIVVDDEDIIINDDTIDAVILSALADSRPSQIEKAIKANKHILAEKPVAMDIESEWKIVNIVENSDRFVAVNLFNRNAWYHKEIIDFIKSGEIGDLAIIRICHMTPGHMPQEGHQPEGPAFHDCGMHYVDVARWYADSEYDTFHSQGIRMWSYKDPWWVQAHGTFQNGVVFDITQGFVYGHMAEKQTHNSYIDIIGTKGIARMSHNFREATVDLHGITQTIIKTEKFGDKKIDILIDTFARAVFEGKNLGLPTVRDSVVASDMAWKMFDDAVKNGSPCIGRLEDMDEIIARRKTLKEGYGLPVWRDTED